MSFEAMLRYCNHCKDYQPGDAYYGGDHCRSTRGGKNKNRKFYTTDNNYPYKKTPGYGCQYFRRSIFPREGFQCVAGFLLILGSVIAVMLLIGFIVSIIKGF